MYLELFSIAN